LTLYCSKGSEEETGKNSKVEAGFLEKCQKEGKGGGLRKSSSKGHQTGSFLGCCPRGHGHRSKKKKEGERKEIDGGHRKKTRKEVAGTNLERGNGRTVGHKISNILRQGA